LHKSEKRNNVKDTPQHDQWAAWLLQRRHGGDPELLRQQLEGLAPLRDKVIANAHIAAGRTVLDVGCGDGLIAFAAAEAVGPTGQVIFSDISSDLLDRCRDLAEQRGLLDRCRFVQAPASDLSRIGNEAVDAVTLRSVLIYEPDKAVPAVTSRSSNPSTAFPRSLTATTSARSPNSPPRCGRSTKPSSRPTRIRCVTSTSGTSSYSLSEPDSTKYTSN
jgi:SAM-dependent methyltransferase